MYRRRDCTDVEDLTAAEMEGREQAMHALSALKTVVPGFEGARLRNFGMTIGTRDSRKIVGRSDRFYSSYRMRQITSPMMMN